jgi:hypothetical protein
MRKNEAREGETNEGKTCILCNFIVLGLEFLINLMGCACMHELIKLIDCIPLKYMPPGDQRSKN